MSRRAFRAQVLKNAISKSQDGDTALFKQMLLQEMRKVSDFYTVQWCVFASPLFQGRPACGCSARDVEHACADGGPGA